MISLSKNQDFFLALDELEKQGYHVKYSVLNAMEYGNIPQNRERIYIVAFRNDIAPDEFAFPQGTDDTKRIKDFVAP